MEKILISACLIGDRCRYDGEASPYPFVEKLKKKYVLVPYCPEIEAGLPVPRVPAEILQGQVINKDGKNLTKVYEEAAAKAVSLCKLLGIHIAILKDGSPACGARLIHDGKFSGKKIPGLGITAKRLIHAGVKVYADTDELAFLLADRDKDLPEREMERYGMVKSDRAKEIMKERQRSERKKANHQSKEKEKTFSHPRKNHAKRFSHSSFSKKKNYSQGKRRNSFSYNKKKAK